MLELSDPVLLMPEVLAARNLTEVERLLARGCFS
jgi:hypothetical protein